jgi:hypothetical protein
MPQSEIDHSPLKDIEKPPSKREAPLLARR